MSSEDLEIPRKIDFNLKYQLYDFEESNKYDLEQSMKKYEQESKIAKHRKKLLVPIKKQNKIWKRNVERCYEKRDELREQQKEKIQMKMDKRLEKINEILSIKKSEMSKDKERKLNAIKSSQIKIYENLEKYKIMTEKERLKTEEIVTKRLNERASRQIENIEKIRSDFHNRNTKSEKHILEGKEKVEIELINKAKEAEEHKFSNFMNWYFSYQKIKGEKKKKKDLHEKIQKRCQEQQREIAEKHEQQRLDTELNLKEAEKKRNEFKKRKHLELLKKANETNQIIEETNERKNELITEIRKKNKDVILFQTSRIMKSYEKDKSMKLNKCNIQ